MQCSLVIPFSSLGQERPREKKKKTLPAFGNTQPKNHGVPLVPLSPWRQMVEERKKTSVKEQEEGGVFKTEQNNLDLGFWMEFLAQSTGNGVSPSPHSLYNALYLHQEEKIQSAWTSFSFQASCAQESHSESQFWGIYIVRPKPPKGEAVIKGGPEDEVMKWIKRKETSSDQRWKAFFPCENVLEYVILFFPE